MTYAETFLYFAYGSNMLTRRLRARTPSARPLGVAVLPDFELRWHKVSMDGSAKCDIVPASGRDAAVYGVMFEIPTAERTALDVAEGLGLGYKERWVDVHMEAGPVHALSFQATNTDRLALPYHWYKELVVAGAREHRLPELYLHALEATRSKDDRDDERNAANLRLARGD